MSAAATEYPEPFGQVSVEAQACGIPVVCSDAGGLPETLATGVSGLVTPKGDVPKLAEALVALARDPARRRALGSAGRQLACASFSLEQIAKNFEAVLADRQFTQRLQVPQPALACRDQAVCLKIRGHMLLGASTGHWC
jgi:glycosyltransferase involved in cell wall biosynthesis